MLSPVLQAPEAHRKNSPVTLKLSIEPQHCPCTSPVRSSLPVAFLLQVQQDILDMYIQVLQQWHQLLLARETGNWKEKKKKREHSALEQIKVSWLKCVAWHNYFMQKLVKYEYQNILFNQA